MPVNQKDSPNAGSSGLVLPPAGWVAFTKNGQLLSFSALAGPNKVDYLRCPDYTYLDGRGQWFDTPEAAANGGLAIKPLDKNRLQIIRISGQGAFVVRRPYGVKGKLIKCEAYDVEGKLTTAPGTQETGTETRIEPVTNAVRYVLLFGKPGNAN
jgi:hypothetical protein